MMYLLKLLKIVDYLIICVESDSESKDERSGEIMICILLVIAMLMTLSQYLVNYIIIYNINSIKVNKYQLH